MNNAEAIAVLKATVPNRINGDAFDLAIKALEKQIPKKLKRSEAKGIGFCSGCGTLVRYDKYCRNCGQRTEIKEQIDDNT